MFAEFAMGATLVVYFMAVNGLLKDEDTSEYNRERIMSKHSKKRNRIKKEKAPVKVYNHKIIFWVSNNGFSEEANKHITRSVQKLLIASGADPKKFYCRWQGGKISTVFQVDNKFKDLVLEVCKKYSITYYYSFFQQDNGGYVVFKDSVANTNNSEGVGYYVGLTKEEAEKDYEFYLYDDAGHYFSVEKKPVFINKTA